MLDFFINLFGDVAEIFTEFWINKIHCGKQKKKASKT